MSVTDIRCFLWRFYLVPANGAVKPPLYRFLAYAIDFVAISWRKRGGAEYILLALTCPAHFFTYDPIPGGTHFRQSV